MKCEICGKEILRDSQCINYKYYHNDCIENLQQENKQLKAIDKEYERLNKKNGRGFKITNVQEYNIDELLSYKKYKDNWNELKKWLEENESFDDYCNETTFTSVLDKMQELEQGSDK